MSLLVNLMKEKEILLDVIYKNHILINRIEEGLHWEKY